MQLEVSVNVGHELTAGVMVALSVGKYAPVRLSRSNQPPLFSAQNTRSDNINNNTTITNTASQTRSPMAHHSHVISTNISNTRCTSPVRGQPAHSCTAPHTAFSPRIKCSRSPPSAPPTCINRESPPPTSSEPEPNIHLHLKHLSKPLPPFI